MLIIRDSSSCYRKLFLSYPIPAQLCLEVLDITEDYRRVPVQIRTEHPDSVQIANNNPFSDGLIALLSLPKIKGEWQELTEVYTQRSHLFYEETDNCILTSPLYGFRKKYMYLPLRNKQEELYEYFMVKYFEKLIKVEKTDLTEVMNVTNQRSVSLSWKPVYVVS